MNKKGLLLIVFLMVVGNAASAQQELNFGYSIGALNEFDSDFAPWFSGVFEYRFKKTIFSVTFEPGLITNGALAVGILPLSLNFNIGNKFRVKPAIGIYYQPPVKSRNTSFSYQSIGWLAGVNFEYYIKYRYIPFIGIKYLQGYIKRYDFYEVNTQILWISAGFKFNLLKVKNVI